MNEKAPSPVPETPATPPPTDEELEKMFSEIGKRQLELDKKVQEIVKKGQNLPPELKKLLDGLTNWPKNKQAEILSKANLIYDQLTEARC